MGCCGGDRYKDEHVKPAQKWDYINLGDFKSSSCFTPVSYGILWIMLAVSLACYIADLLTMINLLKWSKFSNNSISPPQIFNSDAVPKWTFTGCIILSYVLLAYRWMRAVRAMRSGGVAKNYLDPLAARITSVRLGKRGRGYRRFLVFAELTKSKHGTEYVALFVHFAFEAWLRIIFAEGPRNAINAYTIYHLVDEWSKLDGPGINKADSGIQKVWQAALHQANDNHIQAAVVIGMIFTIIIWVIAFIGLVVAFILYVMFLWHHIPKQDGGLRGYCKRKVDKSVERIVSAKIKKALEDEQKQGYKKEGKAGRGAALPEAPVDLKRQPTVPMLGDEESAILPPYGSRSDTPSSVFDREPTLPTDLMSNHGRPGMPMRTMTGDTQGSDAPLLGHPAAFGEGGRSYSPAPGGMPPRSYSPANGRSASPAPPPRPFTPNGELIAGRAASPGPQRSMTPGAGPPRGPMNGNGQQRSFTPAGPPPSIGGRPPPPMRTGTAFTEYSTGRASPAPSQARQLTPSPLALGNPPAGPNAPPLGGLAPYGQPPRTNAGGLYSPQGRQSPASFNRPGQYGPRGPGRETPVQEYEMTPQARPGPPSSGGYQAYKPQTPSTPVGGRVPSNGPGPGIQRSGTAPLTHHESPYEPSIAGDYTDNAPAPRPLQHSNTFGQPPGPGPRW